ncbi:MAG: TatD family hydrolase [Anaerolineaceae bacterium]|nr:TatD family hydrolase [Anaerolineaceae bacterium]
MIDFHCHMDLYTDPMNVFWETNTRRVKVLAVTTSPRAFVKTSQYFTGSDYVTVALGFHPELISQRPSEKKLFFEQMQTTRFLGEIGLDGSSRAKNTLSEQKEFFDEVVYTASICEGKILSIHSRAAVKDVLSILGAHKGKYVPILHWFTGSTKEAERAIELNCWFSVNPNMCFTNLGKKIINMIPFDRLLPETDAPFTQKDGRPYMPWDTTVVTHLAKIYNKGFDEINEMLHKNLQHLLSKK